MRAEIRFAIGDFAELGPYVLDRPLTVGRAKGADLCVPDAALSREHCRLEPTDEGIRVVDLKSRNGVYLRGGKKIEHAVLRPGEAFWIGHTRADIVCSQETDPSSSGELLRAYRVKTPPPRPVYVGLHPADTTAQIDGPPLEALRAGSRIGER